MQPSKHLRVVPAILLCTFFFIACNPKPGSGGATTGGKHKLAFVTNNGSDYWSIALKGTEKAAKEIPGIEVEFRITSDGTAAGQQAVGDDLLAKTTDGIDIRPV